MKNVAIVILIIVIVVGVYFALPRRARNPDIPPELLVERTDMIDIDTGERVTIPKAELDELDSKTFRTGQYGQLWLNEETGKYTLRRATPADHRRAR